MASVMAEIVVTDGIGKGVCITIPIDSTTTVSDAHGCIAERFSVMLKVNNLRLSFVRLYSPLMVFSKYKEHYGDLLVSYMNPFGRIPCQLITVHKSEDMQIFVKSFLAEETVTYRVSSTDTVESLLFLICERYGSSLYDDSRFIYKGRQLEIGRTFSHYEFRGEDTVHHVLRLRGGTTIDFTDVSKEEACRTVTWDASAPKWRQVSKGLALEGRCENNSCVAMNKMVCCNLGFTVLNLDPVKMKNIGCPVCNHPVKPIKPGFNNCYYQITGKKFNLSMYSKPWTRVGNHYSTYDELEAGMESWLELHIQARPLEADPLNINEPMPTDCAMCMATLNHQVGNIEGVCRTNCNHYFHQRCVDDWRVSCSRRNDAFTCPLDRFPLNS